MQNETTYYFDCRPDDPTDAQVKEIANCGHRHESVLDAEDCRKALLAKGYATSVFFNWQDQHWLAESDQRSQAA